jgi:hypothetical protein
LKPFCPRLGTPVLLAMQGRENSLTGVAGVFDTAWCRGPGWQAALDALDGAAVESFEDFKTLAKSF